MDVTTSNFPEAIKIIQKILPSTQFIAFDLEFTGLRFQNFERDHINSLPYQKYKKLKYVAETYQILQLGLSFVTFEGKLKIYPFNFYLFPRNPILYDKNINMQLGCVKFNVECGMDWNKWIREGINYIQLSEMEQIERNDRSKPLKVIMDSLSLENENIVHFFFKEVDKIAKSPDKSTGKFLLVNSNFKLLSTVFYKYIEEKNHDVSIKLVTGKEVDEEDYIAITKITRNERSQQASLKKVEQYGFSLLFEQIWASKKPIIGHNCFLDLLYLYQGLVGRLPENYFEFKSLLKRSGNTFYDTKYIATKHPELFGSETKLEELAKAIRQKYTNKLITIAFQKGFDGYNLNNSRLHEAGYDSYITAWVYIQMQRMKDDIDMYKNLINLNYSFFRVNLAKDRDQINEYFASNLLRINLKLDEGKEDKDSVKQKRIQVVKRMKELLLDVDGHRAYQIHEGYREIFIEIKENKREVLKCLAKMKAKKIFTDIKTFAGYLEWQEERTRKAAILEFHRQRNNKGKEERRVFKNYPKDEPSSEKSQKREKEGEVRAAKPSKQQ